MFVASEDRTAFRFSTKGVPVGSRVSIYCDLFRGQADGFHIDALDGEFSYDVASRAVGGLRVNRIASSPVKVAWRGATESEERLALVLFQHGKGIVTHCGREATVAAGNAIVLSSADPLSMLRTRSCYAYLSLPRKTLASMISNVGAEIMSVIPTDTEALRHLASYLALLTRDTAGMSPELTAIAASHVQDLVALVFGATREAAEVAHGRGLRAARLRAIRADIVTNLRSGEVRAAALAARHGVTPRYIQKLFECEGTTLSRFVLLQRLASVHNMLTDPRHVGSGIGALAYSAGFGDLSTFNREFRRCYGATPSDVRAAAQGDCRLPQRRVRQARSAKRRES
jgi:AraC-like DNA-binding protein